MGAGDIPNRPCTVVVRGAFVRKEDAFGMSLCQAEYLGVQCDGHEDHGVEHFATVNDGAMVWTDDGVVKQGTVEEMVNGRCCK